MGAQPARGRLHRRQEPDHPFPRPFVHRAEHREQAHRGGRGARAALLDGGQFRETAVAAAAGPDQRDDRRRPLGREAHHFPAEHGQEGLIEAALRAAGALGVAAVAAAERPENVQHHLPAITAGTGEDVAAAGRFHQDRPGQQRDELRGGKRTGGAGGEKVAGAASHGGGQLAEHGQAPQREAGIVDVAGAAAAGETAVLALGGGQPRAVPAAEVFRQARRRRHPS